MGKSGALGCGKDLPFQTHTNVLENCYWSWEAVGCPMGLIFLWDLEDCLYSPLHLRLSMRKGSCYHSFHPAVVLVSTSVDILLPFIACSDPTPIGVGGFGHLCRGCCAGLYPSAMGRPHSGARTLPTLSCCQKLYNVLYPKRTRGLWPCKPVGGQGL